jgi:hypothetical protein
MIRVILRRQFGRAVQGGGGRRVPCLPALSGNHVPMEAVAGGWLEMTRDRHIDALAAFRAAERMAGHLAASNNFILVTRAWLVEALVRLGEFERAEQTLAEPCEQDREPGIVQCRSGAAARPGRPARRDRRTHASPERLRTGRSARTGSVARARAIGLLARPRSVEAYPTRPRCTPQR